ncbi:MAG: hypothetical protein KUG82_14095 [Pseudomonadales bacterium]|nr:hypothetical protein [Pseudomonadales bacterium]
MKDNNIVTLHSPAQDAHCEVLKTGAQRLLTQAVETHPLSQSKGLETVAGNLGVVRNGYIPERTIQTGLSDIDALKGLLASGRL